MAQLNLNLSESFFNRKKQLYPQLKFAGFSKLEVLPVL